MQLLVVQLPRGRTALVHFDASTGLIQTNHDGLRSTLFQNGVADFNGKTLFPRDGSIFFSAVFDHLFLNGYVVHWLRSERAAPWN
jgi:hypothetical protein